MPRPLHNPSWGMMGGPTACAQWKEPACIPPTPHLPGLAQGVDETASVRRSSSVAGLHTLEAGGLRTTLITAVETATRRSRELGEPMAKK
jgi:hypothetical protein